jgi:hypothetical protein
MRKESDMKDPMDALTEHYIAISKDYSDYKILGIFLYGSQNYGLATEDSDVDSIAILIPTVEDIILRKPVCKEIIFENGEHCNVKDIREVVKEWKKQSLQSLEVLFTDYFMVKPEYVPYWDNFLNIRNDIAHYDVERTFKSISGQAKQTYLRNPNDKKQIANTCRLYYFLRSYLMGCSYKTCLTSNSVVTLGVKTGEIPLNDSLSKDIADIVFNRFPKLKDTFWNVKSVPEVGEKLDKYLVDLIKRS